MSSSSSFSLVARDLARARGGSTVLDGVDVTVGPRTRLGVVGPNGVGKTTLLRLLAGLDRPDRGSVTRTPPNAARGLPAPGARAVAARDAARVPRPPHRRARGRRGARAQRPPRWPPEPRMPTTRTRARSTTTSRAGGPDFEARARVDVCRSGAAGVAARPADGDAVGWTGGARVARRDPRQPLRRVPPRRAHQRSRLRGARPPRAVPRRARGRGRRREPRPDLPRTRRHARARARRARPQRAPSSAAAGSGTSKRARRRAVTPRRSTPSITAQRDAARSTRPHATPVGGRRRADGEDARHRSRQGAARLPHQRVGAASVEGAGDRAGARAPRRRSRSHGRDGTCASRSPTRQRSGDVVLRLDGAVIERGDFRLGPVDLEIGWAERVAIVGPNGSGKTTLLRALLGRSAAGRR